MAVDDAALNETLARQAEGVANAAGEALAWLGATDDPRAKERAAALGRDLRRAAQRARALAKAARRPMCVSVFGPSQQGKSYLVGSLARRDPDPCLIRFGAETRDFFADINPAGGKESTGLVTRFTVRPVQGLPGLPVVCRMLSQGDVIKIVANAFMEDFDRDTVRAMEPAEVEAWIARFRARAAAEPAADFTADDVFDLFEYFERYFRNHPVHAALKPGPWRELETLAPRLSIPDRIELLGLLWNGTPTLTRVATRMVSALASLGFPEEACASLDALVPRESSIIDVETMLGIEKDGPATLEVATRAGARVRLDRAVLTAITAELCLQLADQPYDFFGHTDLLDFPGARSREKYRADDTEAVAQSQVFWLLRRGKVAYLYQRYLQEQELTSMLLCFRDSNQEVASVPLMVADWIEQTHGATPAQRAQRADVSLFLILTMFDREFELKAGQKDDTVERWSTRFETVIKSFLAKTHDWPLNWSPGRAFDNSFWLRNPAVKNPGLLDYDAEGREAGFRDAARMAMLRANFIANEDVQRHFADPAAAWDAAMALNDGGARRIAEKLRPVCNPGLKRAQVAQQLGLLAARLAQELAPFHVSGDTEAELAKRLEEAQRALDQVSDCAEAQAFGLLLREMQVEVMDLLRLFGAEARRAADNGAALARPIGQSVDASSLRSAMRQAIAGRTATPPAAPAAPTRGESAPRDLAEVLAAAALRHWQETLHRLAAREDTAELFRLDRQGLTTLVSQLVEAERRLGLRDAMARRMREALAYQQGMADRFVKPAMIAERALNDHVTFLGFHDVPPGARPPAWSATARPIFARPPASDDIPALSETPAAFEQDLVMDWAAAFVATVEANVRNVGGAQLDIEANARLGRILAALRDAERQAA